MKFKKNDEVVIIAGDNKDKTGRILKTDPKNQRVYIKDINIVVKHVKPTQGQDGQIKRMEAPIHISNIALLTKKATKTTVAEFSKVGYKFTKDGKKVRIAHKTKKEF